MAKQIGRDYVRRTAKMIEEKFPGSAPALLPKLRALYKAHKD